MSSILERNQNLKANKKTMQDYAEDALYREVWEEVHAQKTYDFVKRYVRWLIAGALVILIIVAGWQLVRHNRNASARVNAAEYEIAQNIAMGGRADLGAAAFEKLAAKSSGGMSDLATFRSAMLDMDAGNSDGAVSKLEKLAKDGATRDFRDLAVLHLAMMRGDSMTPVEFERFLSPVQTKSSPFYYTGLLVIAKKYLANGDADTARVWLDKIINDKDAPGIISAQAEMMR